MSSIYLFQQIGFIALFFNNSVSTFAMKIFAKAMFSDLCSHRCPVCLEVIFSIKME